MDAVQELPSLAAGARGDDSGFGAAVDFSGATAAGGFDVV